MTAWVAVDCRRNAQALQGRACDVQQSSEVSCVNMVFRHTEGQFDALDFSWTPRLEYEPGEDVNGG